MRSIVASLVCLMLIFTVGMSTITHAAEPIVCAEPAGESLSHFDRDGDQAPDADRAVPHHHGTCHGHHIAVDERAGATVPAFHPTQRFAVVGEADHPSALLASALRPPIA